MNRRENVVAETYRDAGWTVVRGGAPDFLILNRHGDEIREVGWVEVKSMDDELNENQEIYRRALESIGAKYELERIPRPPLTKGSVFRARRHRR